MTTAVIDDTIRKRIFFRFLKNNNAFSYFTKDLYLRALHTNNKTLNFPFHLNRLEQTLSNNFREAINFSLYWAQTEEGDNYWHNLDVKWRRFCDKNDI